MLISASSAAIAELARGNKQLQDAIAKENAIVPLINIIRLKKLSNQVKAAMAIEALADHNAAIQREFLDRSTSRHISKLLKARFCLTLAIFFLYFLSKTYNQNVFIMFPFCLGFSSRDQRTRLHDTLGIGWADMETSEKNGRTDWLYIYH